MGRICGAEVDFDGAGGYSGKTDAVGLKLIIGDPESGATPVVAGGGQVANCDKYPFDANNAHFASLLPKGIVSHIAMLAVVNFRHFPL